MNSRSLSALTPENFQCTFDSADKIHPNVFLKSQGKVRGILGVGALSHDTSATLINSENSTIIYAGSEERLSNVKHDSNFPIGSILKCLSLAEKHNIYIDRVAINFDPNLYLQHHVKFGLDRYSVPANECTQFIFHMENLVQSGEILDLSRDSKTKLEIVSLISDLRIAPENKIELLSYLCWNFNVAIKYKNLASIITSFFPSIPVDFVPHHDCHAASAIFGSGFNESAILVIDGHGEYETTSIYKYVDNSLKKLKSLSWPFSLGSIYLAFTRYLGFDYGDEYKVMGMSAYGKPKYADLMSNLIFITDGNLHLKNNDFLSISKAPNSGQIRFTINKNFAKICPGRDKNEALSQCHYDLASSLQSVIENLGTQLAIEAKKLAGTPNLCIAGGVGLNGLMNTSIRRAAIFENIFIFPASSDDGTSLGAAAKILVDKKNLLHTQMDHCYWGSSFTEEEIKYSLDKVGVIYSMPNNIHNQIAKAIANGGIVARFNGAAEFGPRALGNRSILANPTIANMKDTLNIRIKHRESFRPFAPACLKEFASIYFECDSDLPYMIQIVDAKPNAASIIPAVIHADGTARLQTVSQNSNLDFYRCLLAFYKLTNIPILINTSFNVNGEAIVDTPLDAIESFLHMDIDYLAIGPYWISKSENQHIKVSENDEDYLELRRNRYKTTIQSPLSELNVRYYQKWFYPTETELKAVFNN